MRRPAEPAIAAELRPPFHGLLASLLLATLFACASPWPQDSAGLDEQDAAPAVRIKAALVEEPTLSGAAIDIELVGQRARLSGFVETEEQRRTAVSVARRQPGVSGVIDELVVK